MAGLVLTGSFSAAGTGTTVRVDHGAFNITLTGTFVGTVQIERSFDGGTTFSAITALGTPIILSTPASEIFSEPEIGVTYRLNCTSLSTGSINWRISQ